MEWFGYIFVAAVIGAVVLAIYEWRKGLKMTHDAPANMNDGSEPAAFANAERIRGEDATLNDPHGSGFS